MAASAPCMSGYRAGRGSRALYDITMGRRDLCVSAKPKTNWSVCHFDVEVVSIAGLCNTRPPTPSNPNSPLPPNSFLSSSFSHPSLLRCPAPLVFAVNQEHLANTTPAVCSSHRGWHFSSYSLFLPDSAPPPPPTRCSTFPPSGRGACQRYRGSFSKAPTPTSQHTPSVRA